MAADARFTLCVLFEDELRKAAQMLKAMNECTDDEFTVRARDALVACTTALDGVDDDKVLMLANRDTLRRRPKRTKPPGP